MEHDMEEKYYLPVLFTEEERKKYAEWGMNYVLYQGRIICSCRKEIGSYSGGQSF